jgi:hypothetical protein
MGANSSRKGLLNRSLELRSAIGPPRGAGSGLSDNEKARGTAGNYWPSSLRPFPRTYPFDYT